MNCTVRMPAYVCFVSVLTLVAVGVHSIELESKNMEVSRCHRCEAANATANCRQLADVASAACPTARPLCATIASSPNFNPSLTCAAADATPCTLTRRGKQLELVCTCAGHLCNMPYTIQLQHELYNFSTKNPDNSTQLEMFLNSSLYANVTSEQLYRNITLETFESTNNITATKPIIKSEVNGPRVAALKHEATVPPDDEDDGEGSGTLDENKHVASAPAAPSSFLPSEKNCCPPLDNTFLATLLSFFFFTHFKMF